MSDEAYQSAMNDPHNVAILNNLKKSLEEVCKKFGWEDPLTGEEILEQYKKNMHSYAMEHLPNTHITESINKTGWPDLAVLNFMEYNGCDINSIEELSEVTMEWSYDEETEQITMSLRPVFALPQQRIIIEIDVNRGGEGHDI